MRSTNTLPCFCKSITSSSGTVRSELRPCCTEMHGSERLAESVTEGYKAAVASELVHATAVSLLARLSRGELSSRELLELQLRRIEQLNPSVNAVVTLDLERARAEAQRC